MNISNDINSNSCDINIATDIAGVAITKLVRQYGSPLLVYEEKALRDKMCARNHVFKQHYPNFCNSWSFQNNYREEICALLHEEGAIAKLSNQQEYEAAKALGIPDQQISFKGSLKNFKSLESAVKNGATIIIDHWCEIEDLEAVATRLGHVISIGMQLNVKTGIQAYWSSIGFNLDSFQALDTIERIAQNGKLKLNGFYCPIKSGSPNPNNYINPLAKILELGYKIEDRFGWTLEFMDLGQSLPALSNQTLKEKSAQHIAQSVNESMDAICDAMEKSLRPGHTPKLIIDAAHDVINESGTLIVQICECEQTSEEIHCSETQAKNEDLHVKNWHHCDIALGLPIIGPTDNGKPKETFRSKRAAVYSKAVLPPLFQGDRLIFSNSGIYPQISQLGAIDDIPCELIVRESGQVEVIRSKCGQSNVNP